MRPDMLLAMMFLGIMLFPKTKYVVLLSIVTGVVSALTTTVPGGQLANIIDKPITALIFLGLFLLVKNKVNGNISAPVLTVIGTAIKIGRASCREREWRWEQGDLFKKNM